MFRIRGPVHQLQMLQLCRTYAAKIPTINNVGPQPFNSIPTPSTSTQVKTLLKLLRKDFDLVEHMSKRHQELGPVYKENILPGIADVTVSCCSPADTEAMLRSDGKYPVRPQTGPLESVRNDLKLYKGISEASGEEWYKVRSVVNNHFLQNRSVWSYGEKHLKVSQDFTEYIAKHLDSNNEVPDFENAIKRWSLEAAGVFSLDTRLGLFDDEVSETSLELIKAMDLFFENLSKLLFGVQFWKTFETFTYKDFRNCQKEIYNAVSLHRRAVQHKGSNGKETNQLQSFLNSSLLTDNEKDMVMVDFLSGGIETTAMSSIFPLYLLAIHPEKQDILRQEIQKYIGDFTIGSGKVLAEMPYLNAVLRETQRIFPFVPFYSRKFKNGIVLSNYQVPPDQLVINSANFVNNKDPAYFDEPDVFKPERWFDPAQRKKAAFATVGSFGVGARKCPGRKFALQEIHSLIAAILSQYRIEYHYKPIRAKLGLVSYPSEKARFTFIPLNE
uniref:Cytochrome P450 10-like n=1 Tax=Phallusia mammillata TaxID=59560 RepID=A0A6F9DAH2_9ASCI|nr:cytochrome P450 10-like [Phallusia mammillata]